MKTISLIVLILALSLNLFSQRKVNLGWKEKYFLDSSEINIPLNDIIIENYSIYDPDTIHQVPLSKYIKSDNYKLYIGWAIFDTPNSIYKYYLSNIDYGILEKDTVFVKKFIYFKLLANVNESYILKYIFITKKSKFTIVLTYCSDNEEYLTKLYNDDNFILAKLNKKKK